MVKIKIIHLNKLCETIDKQGLENVKRIRRQNVENICIIRK